MLDLLGLDDTEWGILSLRGVTIIVSVLATWGLFLVVLSQMPMQHVPVRTVAPAALAIAVVFEILKSLGAIYLTSVMSSPAGLAFGPILGVMVFAYLASRIVLYGAAWSASDPKNQKFITVDEVEADGVETTKGPVYLAPVYEESRTKTRDLATAAGVGAVIATVFSRSRRR